MTLWSVYHTLFGVFATFTVSYITPMVWYPHFIFYSVAKATHGRMGMLQMYFVNFYIPVVAIMDDSIPIKLCMYIALL